MSVESDIDEERWGTVCMVGGLCDVLAIFRFCILTIDMYLSWLHVTL